MGGATVPRRQNGLKPGCKGELAAATTSTHAEFEAHFAPYTFFVAQSVNAGILWGFQDQQVQELQEVQEVQEVLEV